MRAKLQQNEEVRQAVESTFGLDFTHQPVDENGRPQPDSPTLPASVYCRLWTDLRDELLRSRDTPPIT
jgi:hypothetical protein